MFVSTRHIAYSNSYSGAQPAECYRGTEIKMDVCDYYGASLNGEQTGGNVEHPKEWDMGGVRWWFGLNFPTKCKIHYYLYT